MLREDFLACEGLSGAFAAYAIAIVIQIVNENTSIYTCKEESTEVLRTVELLSSEQQNTLCHVSVLFVLVLVQGRGRIV